MMKQKKYFKNLNADEFRHKDEIELEEAFLKKVSLDKVMNVVSDFGLKATEASLLGQMVLLSKESAPKLYQIVEDVCRILDCDKIPRIYLRHSWVQIYTPIESDGIFYIVIDDSIVENYDEDMLYYCFGNAVTMYKAGHICYANIAAYMMPSNPLFSILKFGFMPFLHAMDVTSDRGGLLACQSFAAAVKCILIKTGMPVQEVSKLFSTDAEAEDYVSAYLKEVDRIININSGKFSALFQNIQTSQTNEGATNRMLRELYFWYRNEDGYNAIIQKYGV